MSHDNMASLPEYGEQITFEIGDVANVNERVTMRVSDVHTGNFGYVILEGWEIDGSGFVARSLQLSVPVATVEARRVHRRVRS